MSLTPEQQKQIDRERDQINLNIKNIKHKIVVLSGKGGVGKSSIAANLAVWLSMNGKKTGLLDVDIHGPSIPKLLNLEGRMFKGNSYRIEPVQYSENLKVMSVGFMTSDEKTAMIWRGPMKHNVIKQFVSDVSWGQLDYMIVDCPPGTGDEPLSIIHLLNKVDGAVVVTTPQQLAVSDVKRCLTFCKQLGLAVLGVVENMSGFYCPHCNRRTDIFGDNGGRQMAEDFNVPFLGSIPIDPDMIPAADKGNPFICYEKGNPAVTALKQAFDELLRVNNLKLQKEY